MNYRRFNKLTAILFCAVLFAALVLFFLLPSRDYSQREKRYLTLLPEFSLSSLMSGEYTENVKLYIADRFPGRDFFVGVNSYYEKLMGRQYTKDFAIYKGRLIGRPAEYNEEVLSKNLALMNDFADTLSSAGIPVRLMLVPSSGAVYADKSLPWGEYPDYNIINEVYSGFNGETISLLDAFSQSENKKELYYTTDHHWTSYGAYLAAKKYCETAGLLLPPLENYSAETVSEFYGSSWSSSGLWLKGSDNITLLSSGNKYWITDEKGINHEGVFYRERINEQDKYTVFLDGNHPYMKVENLSVPYTGNNLLVIRDSFSNSLGCFLADMYDSVTLVDLRYYKLPLDKIIAENEISQVLIEYNVENFMKDSNLDFLSAGAFGTPEIPPESQPAPEETAQPRPTPEPIPVPPAIIPEELFDNLYYLGDSVIGNTIQNFANTNYVMQNTIINSVAMLSVHNLAINDTTINHGGRLMSLPVFLETVNPPKLILALGINDLPNRPAETVYEEAIGVISWIRQNYPDLELYWQGCTPIRDWMTTFNQQKVDSFNQMLKDSAVDYGFCFIDISDAFRDENGNMDIQYHHDATHMTRNAGPIWYYSLFDPNNYTNLPVKYYVYPEEPQQQETVEEVPAPPEQDQQEQQTSEIDSIYETILSTGVFEGLISLDTRLAENYLGIYESDCAEGRFYISGDNLRADELWIVKAQSTEQSEAMKAKAEARIAQKAESLRLYIPEEYEVAMKGKVAQWGDYIIMVISRDNDKVLSIFG